MTASTSAGCMPCETSAGVGSFVGAKIQARQRTPDPRHRSAAADAAPTWPRRASRLRQALVLLRRLDPASANTAHDTILTVPHYQRRAAVSYVSVLYSQVPPAPQPAATGAGARWPMSTSPTSEAGSIDRHVGVLDLVADPARLQ